MNFLDFGSDTIKKQGIINFSSYSRKSYASVGHNDSDVNFFLGKWRVQPFVHFSGDFSLETALRDRKIMMQNLLVLQISVRISSGIAICHFWIFF